MARRRTGSYISSYLGCCEDCYPPVIMQNSLCYGSANKFGFREFSGNVTKFFLRSVETVSGSWTDQANFNPNPTGSQIHNGGNVINGVYYLYDAGSVGSTVQTVNIQRVGVYDLLTGKLSQTSTGGVTTVSSWGLEVATSQTRSGDHFVLSWEVLNTKSSTSFVEGGQLAYISFAKCDDPIKTVDTSTQACSFYWSGDNGFQSLQQTDTPPQTGRSELR
jgi:hypothetical protein